LFTLKDNRGWRRTKGARADLMKNISSPVMVKGHQWGILRIMVKVK